MKKEHLTYFRVENFKCFDVLELTDIGQFNLIVGDNNVGKTSLLEALCVKPNRVDCLSIWHKILLNKGIKLNTKTVFDENGSVKEFEYPEENFIHFFANDSNKPIVIRLSGNWGSEYVELKEIHLTEKEIASWQNQDENTHGSFWFDSGNDRFMGISPDGRYISFSRESEYYDDGGEMKHAYQGIENAGLYAHTIYKEKAKVDVPIVPISIPVNGLLVAEFDQQFGQSKSSIKEFVEGLSCILPHINDVRISKIGGQNQLMISLEGEDKLRPIALFGESVLRVAQILIELNKAKGSRLMIDEVDTGIHYSRMKPFLKSIVLLAQKLEVQLFMTTHSLECQQLFADVFEDIFLKEIQSMVRQYSLIHSKKQDKIIILKRDLEQLGNALEIGYDTRGGNPSW